MYGEWCQMGVELLVCVRRIYNYVSYFFLPVYVL
jgi:hypothetical protein